MTKVSLWAKKDSILAATSTVLELRFASPWAGSSIDGMLNSLRVLENEVLIKPKGATQGGPIH